ncbi:MAG: flagellar hook-length control protein FliK [Proteobacteria bacterium]|nr:flagellar hook-length control protein FliK [Pseudomonadota bacterium]
MPASTGPPESTVLSGDHSCAEQSHVEVEGAIFHKMIGGLLGRRKEDTVQNSNGECHLDGSMDRRQSDDFDKRPQSKAIYTLGHICSSNEQQNQKQEEKSNNNEALGVHSTSERDSSNHRVYPNYEAAGLPREELKKLVRLLHRSAIAGRRQVNLSLRLREIGEIKFDVRIVGKKVFVNAGVETLRAATAMALAISDLKDLLEEHGLELARFDVTTGYNKDTTRGEERESPSGNTQRQTDSRSVESIGEDSPMGIQDNSNLHILA